MKINKYLGSSMNVVLQQNIRDFTQSFELSHRLSHSRFLITGCTGLIGSILAHSLLAIKQDIDILGRSGPAAPWLSVAAATLAAIQSQHPQLTLSGVQGGHYSWATVVSPFVSPQEAS